MGGERIDQEKGSVGQVSTQTVDIPLPAAGLRLRKGGVLRQLQVAYETYGKLSSRGDNVVYICHALTGDAHVAGWHTTDDRKPGWWDDMVGPGKGIDTDYYHVICANILGGCKGTTGPCSINPDTGRPFGATFPSITVTDMVVVQKMLLEHLGITKLAAVIGGSLGGMQVLEWSIRYPAMVDRCVCIASGASLSAQALAFDVVARDAIVSDPNWAGGQYHDKGARPDWGLSHARKIGHITYLSPEIMQRKFGRERMVGTSDGKGQDRFQIESYLDHQGRKLVERFDANSYLRISEAMDEYDLEGEFDTLKDAFRETRAKFLIIALSSDWLFPPEQSVALADALLKAGKHVSCCTLRAPHGHDAFLVDIERLADTVRAFLPWVTPDRGPAASSRSAQASAEFERIRDVIQPGTRVLDLGCGAGDLLTMLREAKSTSGFGIDISVDNVIQAIDKGHDVFQGDLDEGLAIIPDQSYDYAVLSSTLQVVRRPQVALREMVRVAREGVITFPNFGHWRNRLMLGFGGRMPKTSAIPYEWYESPNIHLTTVKDFVDLCRSMGIRVLEVVSLSDCPMDRFLVGCGLPNLGAPRVLIRLAAAR